MPMNPHVQEALVHGLLGAAGWGGLGALTGALEAKPGHRGHGALMGGLTGAALGGVTHGAVGGLGSVARQSYRAPGASSKRSPFGGEPSGFDPWAQGAQKPGSGGSGFNRDPGFWEDYARNRGTGWAKAENMGEQGLGEVAPWLQNVASKADAKSAFRAQARAAHPDVGGTDRAMQDLNAQWNRAQAHPAFSKLSHAYANGSAAALARFGVTR